METSIQPRGAPGYPLGTEGELPVLPGYPLGTEGELPVLAGPWGHRSVLF